MHRSAKAFAEGRGAGQGDHDKIAKAHDARVVESAGRDNIPEETFRAQAQAGTRRTVS